MNTRNYYENRVLASEIVAMHMRNVPSPDMSWESDVSYSDSSEVLSQAGIEKKTEEELILSRDEFVA